MKKKDLKSFIKEVLSEELNPQDTITMDVPLFIRALEYAKEDAKTDMDLHNATEKALSVSEGGKTLTMADYNSIFSNTESINEDDYMQSDDESDMAHSQLLSIKSNTDELMNMIDKDEQLDAWVQAKLTKAQDYLEAVSNYLKGEETNQSTLNEAGSANARGVAIAFKKDILDSMEFGTGAEERFPLILKYIEDNEIKGIDPEEVVVELNDLMRDVNEKKLTTAEKNKKEEIVKSMKKDFKGPKVAMYAIATDKAKKMAETIAKKLKEGNLGHNETSSIHQEGNSWIVTYKNMNGTQEKVFKTEKEARDFFNKTTEGNLGGDKFTHPSHINNYSIYLSTEPIYTSLSIDRLKSVLYSLKNELGEDLDDYIIMKNSTKDTKSAGELGWDLSNVKPFDNLESLKSKIEAIETK